MKLKSRVPSSLSAPQCQRFFAVEFASSQANPDPR